jgi:lipoate-protein ligase B
LIAILQLGTIDYATGLRLQDQLVALRKEEKIGDVLLLLEHKPVITLGRNAKAANIVASPELLSQRGVELFETNRGGDVTFHGPGQIVGYPIFDLRGYSNSTGTNREGLDFSRAAISQEKEAASAAEVSRRKHLGAVDFVRRLEEVLIRTCADFAIPAKRIPGLTGVWTDPDPRASPHSLSFRAKQVDSLADPLAESRNLLFAESTTTLTCESNREGHDFSRANSSRKDDATLAAAGHNSEAKLAAIGIHISRFVTSHGFALNVNTDLSCFDLIIPCGITSKPVTSMQKELGHPLAPKTVAESISRNFGVVFQSQILWVDTLEALLGRTVGVPMKPPAEIRQLHKEDDTTWA